jgi:hypothetical protein
MAKKKQKSTVEEQTQESVLTPNSNPKVVESPKFTMAVTFEDGVEQIKKSIITFFATIFITNPEYNDGNSESILRNADILEYINSLTEEELCQIYNDIMNTCFSFVVGNGLFYKFDTDFIHIERNNNIGEMLGNLRNSLNDILDKSKKETEEQEE